MIDVHCHILPGFDDGAKDFDASLSMAKQAINQGITTVIATPHHRDGTYECTYDDVVKAVAMLNDEFKHRNIDLTVLPGQEVHFFQDVLIDYENRNLLTLAGSSYMLIELPSTYMPEFYEFVFHELLILGVTPIIAHPERNAALLEDDHLVNELIEMGVLFQVTGASILGKFGSKIQNKVLKWCKQNYVHFVASDAHNVTSRSFDLLDAYNLISSKLGKSYVEFYQRNAYLLVNQNVIETKILKSKSKLKFWKK